LSFQNNNKANNHSILYYDKKNPYPQEEKAFKDTSETKNTNKIGVYLNKKRINGREKKKQTNKQRSTMGPSLFTIYIIQNFNKSLS
jgi:hypothetical protein